MFRRQKKLNSLFNSKLGYEERYFVDEHDRGIIDVGIENYDDLFSYYDIDGKTILDPEFIEFIEQKADSIPLSKDLTLCLHVPAPNEEKRFEIEKTLKDTYIQQCHIIGRKIKSNTKFSISMLVTGLILFLSFIFFSHSTSVFLNDYLSALLEVATWVFLWEAIDSYFLYRRDLQDEILKKYRFVQSKIVVKEYSTSKEKQSFSKNAKTLSNMITNSNILNNDNKNINQNKEKENQNIQMTDD